MTETASPQRWTRVTNFVSTEIDDSIVILSLEAGRYYTFTSSGSAIWELLDQPQSVESLVEALVGRFEVSPDHCAASVTAFLETLNQKDLVRLV